MADTLERTQEQRLVAAILAAGRVVKGDTEKLVVDGYLGVLRELVKRSGEVSEVGKAAAVGLKISDEALERAKEKPRR
jgi:sulfate adenylyltransferase subunit 1 (EFTu-like GTPase family)